jgi:outer dense fiber protein 2
MLKKQVAEATNLIEWYKSVDANSKVDKPESDEQKRNDLDKIKEKLQMRLSELEPLPELLKNTELKLHDAMKKLKDYEQRNSDQNKTIDNLQKKIDERNDIEDGRITDRKPNQSIQEPSEAKYKSIEEDNHDLLRQLALKDDALRDVNVSIYFLLLFRFLRFLVVLSLLSY